MKRIVILFLGLLILLGENCTKNPTRPVVGQAPILYAVSERYPDGYSRVYLIDTAIDSLIDTILVAGLGATGLSYGVSPDGSRLYLNGGALDTRTRTLISGAVSGVPTPDGKYVIVDGIPFQLYDAKTDRLVFTSDTVAIRVNATGNPFDSKRGLVYGTREGYKIAVFNYRTFKLVEVIDPTQIGGYSVPVVDLVVTHDGRKLYYTSSVGFHLFTGINLIDERVVALQLLNSISFLAITPDGEYIYLTDPGGYIIEPEPTEKIGVYSPALEQPLQSIDVSNIPSPCTLGYIATDQIALSPDGRKAYVTIFDFCGIIVIDTETNQVTKVIQSDVSIWSLAIQKPLRNIFFNGG